MAVSVAHSPRLSAKYGFEKPNDSMALGLMNAAAVGVMKELVDIQVAYGISDEFRYDDSLQSVVPNRTLRWDCQFCFRSILQSVPKT